MKPHTYFDLQVAITEHLQEVDQNHLLNHEEWDELFDHFLAENQALTESGLTEKEAFSVSKLRFGDTTLISQEYQNTKPFGAFRKTLISILIVFFSILIVTSLVNLLSIVSYNGGIYIGLTEGWIRYGDFALKFLLMGGIVVSLAYRIKRQSFFNKIELWLIPILGMLLPIYLNNSLFLNMNQYRTANWADRHLMGQLMINSRTCYQVLILVLMLLCYILIFKERKATSRMVQ